MICLSTGERDPFIGYEGDVQGSEDFAGGSLVAQVAQEERKSADFSPSGFSLRRGTHDVDGFLWVGRLSG